MSSTAYSDEIVEACRWLKATGFPQYVQLFKNGAFPIDVNDAKVNENHENTYSSYIHADKVRFVKRKDIPKISNFKKKCQIFKQPPNLFYEIFSDSLELRVFRYFNKFEYWRENRM